MTKRRKKIPESLKSKILAEALVPGCRIVDLAKNYGIAAWTIYTWRKEMSIKSSITNTSTKFVEAVVASDNDITLGSNLTSQDILSSNSTNSYYASPTLQKVLLTFKEFSCALEGKITPSTLLKIIEVIDNDKGGLL